LSGAFATGFLVIDYLFRHAGVCNVRAPCDKACDDASPTTAASQRYPHLLCRDQRCAFLSTQFPSGDAMTCTKVLYSFSIIDMSRAQAARAEMKDVPAGRWFCACMVGQGLKSGD
jgi:hypothetical protein